MLEYLAIVCYIFGAAAQTNEADPCLLSACAANERCVAINNDTICLSPPCNRTFECIDARRKGQCPSVMPEVQPDFTLCVDHCKDDLDCQPSQKCCRSGCGAKICINALDKPGICPSMETSYIGLCVAKCKNDNDCPSNKKCCGGCPRKCMSPLNETAICNKIHCPDGYECSTAPVICKTSPCYPIASCVVRKKSGKGFCPDRPIPKSDICRNDCGVDGHCHRNEICCQVGCHQICSIPAPNKKGNCPSDRTSTLTDMIHRIGPCRPECARDGDCIGDQKCCGKCGKCTDPISHEKPGKCPESFLSIFPMMGFKLRCHNRHRCITDNDCPGRKKCCGECPRKCRKPRRQSKLKRKRTCPSIVHVLNCKRSRVQKCIKDSDCRSRSKCCPSITCGKVCVRVIRSMRFWFR